MLFSLPSLLFVVCLAATIVQGQTMQERADTHMLVLVKQGKFSGAILIA